MAARGGGAMPLVLFGLFEGPAVYDAEADPVEGSARADGPPPGQLRPSEAWWSPEPTPVPPVSSAAEVHDALTEVTR